MELQLTGKNVKITPTVRRYVERKVDKLSRHLPDIIESIVEVTEEKTKSAAQRFVAQIILDSHGTILRGEERGDDLLAAIDKVVATMDRQIEHYKGKLYKKGRGSSLARTEFQPEPETTAPAQRVTKVKRFAVKPMSADEAVDQMELLGHDFFLFLNAETDSLNLLYRRKDGNYGLIEPELG